MDDDYFWSLVRKPQPKKMRRCLKCGIAIFGFTRVCGKCSDWMAKQSVHCGEMII